MHHRKHLVFRIRKRYFDAIVSGEKRTEYRPDTQFWRSRIDGKGVEGEPPWIAVFICGKRVHRREINLIQKVITPASFSEQGKQDVPTPMAYCIHLGKAVNFDETKLLEELASLEHEQWASWIRHQMTVLGIQPFSGTHWERWEKQTQVPYANLSEKEKESDRKFARKVLEKLRSLGYLPQAS